MYKKIKKIAHENNYKVEKIHDSYYVNNIIIEIIQGECIRVNGHIVELKYL